MAGCYDCGLPYGDEHGFPDLLVPEDVWLKISPTGHEGGLLCPNCMCRRAHAAGIEEPEVRFVSGPFADHEWQMPRRRPPWESIDTWPRNESPVLLSDGVNVWRDVWWGNPDYECFSFAREHSLTPTHWMPLPEPPPNPNRRER